MDAEGILEQKTWKAGREWERGREGEKKGEKQRERICRKDQM